MTSATARSVQSHCNPCPVKVPLRLFRIPCQPPSHQCDSTDLPAQTSALGISSAFIPIQWRNKEGIVCGTCCFASESLDLYLHSCHAGAISKAHSKEEHTRQKW